MNHQHDQARAPAAPATTAQHHGSLDPGRSSRSALLRKPDHAVASGLTHHVPGDHAPEPLAAAQQSQMSRAYGFDFSGVLIRRDSPAATGATRALFKDGEIHFRQGEYRPGTPDGDRLIAHELAHVVQQRGGRGERTGSREELEREADHAASLAARGQPAPIALRADPSASYAFHDGEDHDEPLDDTADEAAPDHATHDQDADNESPDRAKQRRKNRAIGPDGAARDRAKQDGPHQRITAQQPSTTQSANKLLDRKKLDDKKPSGASKASVAQRNDRHAGDPHQNQVAADAAKRREPAAGTAKHGNAIANPASQSQPYASRSNRGDTPANHPTHSDANRVVAKANDSHASPANHGAQPDHPLTNEPRASHANHDVAKPSGSMPAPLATGERTGAGIERGDASRASSFATPSSPSGGTPLPATSRRGSAGDTVPAIDTRDPATLLESLAQAPPSRAAVTLAQVHRAAPRAFEAQREHAQAAIPRVPAPTGLPPRTAPRSRIALNSTPGPAPADSPKPKTGDAVSVPRTVVPEAPAAAAQAPNTLPGPRSNAEQGGNQDAALARSTQHAIASISAPVHHVPSRANGMPSVRLRGECDPDQIDSAHAVSADQMRTATHQAALDARRDFGENDILPAANNQVLSATLPARAVTVSSAGKPSPTLDLPPDAVASLDANASPFLREAIGAQQRRYAQGKAQHDAQIQTEHTRHRADVAKLEQEARAKQQAARADSRVSADGARRDFQREVDHVETEFRTRSAAAHKEHSSQVHREQQLANRKAAGHMRDAERKADAAKRKAEDDVARKKQDATKESGGWTGWLKSKATQLIDGIRAGINVICDNLRKAVKQFFDFAKQLATAAIEVGRRAVVGLIKAYGEVLKGLAKVALAGLPPLRHALVERIDQVVQAAEKLADAAAETLKAGVAALIDFLASTVDKILGLIQDLYNAALTIIQMLISGDLRAVLTKIGWLVDSAKTAPEQFETAAYEELLGGNLDEPLTPQELKAAGRDRAAVNPLGTPATSSVDSQTAIQHADDAFPSPPYTKDNIGVDAVAEDDELEPDLQQEIARRIGDGDGEIEFGESNDESRSLEALRSAGPQPSSNAETSAEQAVPAQTALPPASATAHGATAKGAYTDGLTPPERAKAKWDALKHHLKEWWEANWPKVLIGGVIAAAVLIIAIIFTGGTILAALPAIMAVVGPLFLGLTLVQIADHIRDYLTKAWAGQLKEGGKSLAKALAAGAIELISWLTFKVGSVALKGMKGIAKGAQAVGTGFAAAGKGTAHLVGSGAHYMLRGGKVILRGIGRGIGRAAKSLKDLGTRLLARTRFKGFRIRVAQRRWRLEGRINLWILLAGGPRQIPPQIIRGRNFQKRFAKLLRKQVSRHKVIVSEAGMVSGTIKEAKQVPKNLVKHGTKRADQAVIDIEELRNYKPGDPPLKIDTYSNKSRDFSSYDQKGTLAETVEWDVAELAAKYSGRIEFRRAEIAGFEATVEKITLVYDRTQVPDKLIKRVQEAFDAAKPATGRNIELRFE